MQMQHLVTQINLYMQLAHTTFARRHRLTVRPNWNDTEVIRASCNIQRIIQVTTCDLQLAIIQTRTGVPETFCRQTVSIERTDEHEEFAGILFSLIRKSQQLIARAFRLHGDEWNN